jgi:RES domain-containing protein
MLKSSHLAKALQACPRTPVVGNWYRSVAADRYVSFFIAPSADGFRPLSGLGARRTGARFTPPNGPASLYVAGDVETSTREALQITVGTPIQPPAGVIRTIYTVTVNLTNVVDLRAPAVLRFLETSAEELAASWRFRRNRSTPPTQNLGRLAAKVGLEGLIFQSTKGPGPCLVIFTDKLLASSFLEVRDGNTILERLPAAVKPIN